MVHLSNYQARDREVIDYGMQQLRGTGLWFRGPFPKPDQDYFACVGAAQTLGCFCEHPFPALVSRETGLPALNLGYGGAGPEFFLLREELLPWLNRARFVILQVMSARSQSNPLYDCGGLEYVTLRRDGRQMGAGAAFTELLTGPAWMHRLPLPSRLRRKLANLAARPRARAVVAATRAAWVTSNLALIDRIEVPVILLWFSKRRPDYRARYTTQSRLFGEFPHLVTPRMLAPLKSRVAAYVEAVTGRGSPQPLVSRFTGLPVSVDPAVDRPDLSVPPWHENHYYPSPQMHEDAAAALLASGALVPHLRLR